MSTKDAMQRMDATIGRVLERHDLIDRMEVAGQTVDGYFEVEWVEEGDGEEAFGGYLPTFDCRAADLPAAEAGATVEVVDHGTYRYLRRRPNGTGRVLVLLGSLLDDASSQ